MTGSYLVVLADVVASRRNPNRMLWQRNFLREVERVRKTTDAISGPAVVQGDELQVVYKRTTKRLFHDIVQFCCIARPHSMRVVISLGEIQTTISPQSPTTADGPAFHQARELMDLMKAKKRENISMVNPIKPDLEVECEALRVLSAMMRKWEDSRWKILQQMMNDTSAENIAKNLNLTQAAVYKSMKDGNLRTIIRFFSALQRRLNKPATP